jgi:chloramphenicol 3-O phosphotransferase
MVNAGFVLLLNGCSSAGKTSLARVLQARRPMLHLQLDAFRAMEPEGYFTHIDPGLRHLRVAALCRAMNAAARQFAVHGQEVILDHVLPAQAWAWLEEDLAGVPLHRVGVLCELPELERREATRSDRRPGLARSQRDDAVGAAYDFTVDTTRTSAAECAAQVLAWLATR